MAGGYNWLFMVIGNAWVCWQLLEAMGKTGHI